MEATLWRDDARLARPVAAAGQLHDRRARLFLELRHDGVAGMGEIAPQPERLHGDPSTGDVVDELRNFTLPAFADAARRESAVPSWTRVARFAGSRPASPFAAALVEMAALDRELRAEGSRLGDLWPATGSTPVTATVSLLDDVEWIVAGAQRVRAKTAPGALRASALERLAALDVPVLLDFNCSARGAADVHVQLLEVAGVCTVAAVEQPFAPGNLADHAALAVSLGVAVSLDESVRARRDLDAISHYRAAAMVCIKPARVGGLANARAMVLRARDLGLAAYLGGFFESAFARGVHRVLADHCVSEPSDLAVVARVDLAGPEAVAVPDGVGVAPGPSVLEGATRLGEFT
ncbi:MAG: enolase C-terminal domain-like protein [Acidimicrobiales bacterium]